MVGMTSTQEETITLRIDRWDVATGERTSIETTFSLPELVDHRYPHEWVYSRLLNLRRDLDAKQRHDRTRRPG